MRRPIVIDKIAETLFFIDDISRGLSSKTGLTLLLNESQAALMRML
jgi:hypothetical protein